MLDYGKAQIVSEMSDHTIFFKIIHVIFVAYSNANADFPKSKLYLSRYLIHRMESFHPSSLLMLLITVTDWCSVRNI